MLPRITGLSTYKGERGLALEKFEASVRILRGILGSDDFEVLRELGLSLLSVAHECSRLGRPGDMLQAASEAATIFASIPHRGQSDIDHEGWALGYVMLSNSDLGRSAEVSRAGQRLSLLLDELSQDVQKHSRSIIESLLKPTSASIFPASLDFTVQDIDYRRWSAVVPRAGERGEPDVVPSQVDYDFVAVSSFSADDDATSSPRPEPNQQPSPPFDGAGDEDGDLR